MGRFYLPPRARGIDRNTEEIYRAIEDHLGRAVDHGGTLGLGDDDHPQYLNTARHDNPSLHRPGDQIDWGHVATQTTFGQTYFQGTIGAGVALEGHRHGTPPDPWVPANRPVLDAVRVRRTDSLIINSQTETTVPFQVKVHGKSSMWDGGSGILLPFTGLYTVGGEVRWPEDQTDIRINRRTFHLLAGGRILTDPHTDGGSYNASTRSFSLSQVHETQVRLIAGETMTMTVLHHTVDGAGAAYSQAIQGSLDNNAPGTAMWATYEGPCDV